MSSKKVPLYQYEQEVLGRSNGLFSFDTTWAAYKRKNIMGDAQRGYTQMDIERDSKVVS
jgi:hypothetical protein